MDEWQAQALARFPELRERIEENQSGPIGLWSELYFALESAYEKQPIDEHLIGRIYNYAAWCFGQADTGEVKTDVAGATAVGFIESLPLHRRVSEDLYRWFSLETFEGCEKLLRYHLSDEEYRKFHDEFVRKKKEFSGPSRL